MANYLKISKPDAILLCETNLSDRHNLRFANYNFIRTNRSNENKYSRGTGILLSSKYDHHLLDTRCWGLRSLECTAIQIPTDKSPISLVSVYRNPSDYSNTSFTDDLNNICLALHHSGPLIIGGDLNAKHSFWKNSNCCKFGDQLYDWLMTDGVNNNVKLESTYEPTFYSGNHKSFLDIFIISEPIKVLYSHGSGLEIEDYNSDHRAVVLQCQIFGQPKRPEKHWVPDYGKANWRQLRKQVDEEIVHAPIYHQRNMTTTEIDKAIVSIENIISQSMKTAIPMIEIRQNTLLNLPAELEILIKHKNHLRRQWQRKKYCNNAHLLKSEITNITKIIKDRIKIVYAEKWTTTLQAIKLNNNTFKNINKLTKRKSQQSIHTLTINNTAVTSDQDKAEALATHFESAHELTINLGNSNFTSTINTDIRTVFDSNTTPIVQYSEDAPSNPKSHFIYNFHTTSFENLKTIIKNRANKKSAGIDNISNFIIRKLGDTFTASFASIINQSFNIGYFPIAWKSAKVIPIAKKSKPPKEVNSYRPIALLPCLSKIYECVIKQKLDHQCEELNVIPDDQFGFRHSRSTCHPLVQIQQDVVNNFTKKTPTIAVTMDIAKAFDSVWREGLIHKMYRIFNIDPHLCRIIFNYLSSRTFQVKINSAMSPVHPIKAGVPQGGVLSAMLYIIYVADMPSPPIQINGIKRLQYADDILLYISSRNLIAAKARLETYIQETKKYLEKWKLLCSDEKSESIIFKNKKGAPTINRIINTLTIQIGNTISRPKKQIKYLGVVFQKNGMHTRHIDNVINKTNAATYAIRPLLRKVNGLHTNIKLLCYKQLLRPIISYAFPCWSNVSSHQMERLRRIERKCLRVCLSFRRKPNSPHHRNNSELYSTARITRIDHHMIRLALKFFDRNRIVDNSEIIKNLQGHYAEELFLTTPNIKPPEAIDFLHAHGRLFTNDKLLYYHRRYDRRHNGPAADLVYNQNQ